MVHVRDDAEVTDLISVVDDLQSFSGRLETRHELSGLKPAIHGQVKKLSRRKCRVGFYGQRI
jgi:hypothetical protein